MQHPVPVLRSNVTAPVAVDYTLPSQASSSQASQLSHGQQQQGQPQHGLRSDLHRQDSRPSEASSWTAPLASATTNLNVRRTSWPTTHSTAVQQHLGHTAARSTAVDPTTIAARERDLVRRFWSCEGYVKYREGQRKKKDDPNQEWNDDVEAAFIQALARWPPMGRNQVKIHNTLHGRNGLISNYIFAVTGQVRDRKQISSHIQTLRPKIARDPHLRRYFPEMKSADLNPKRRSANNKRRHDSRGQGSKSCASRRSARVPLIDSGARIPDHDTNAVRRLEPKVLEMFLQHQVLADGSSKDAVRLHTYAEMNHESQRPSLVVQNWDGLFEEASISRMTPSMASCFKITNSSDNSLILAEVGISLPESCHWEENVELGVALKFSTDTSFTRQAMYYRNTFFKDGKIIAGDRDCHEAPVRHSSSGTIDIQPMFGAKFWASILSGIVGQTNADEILRKIVILQELYAGASPQEEAVMTVLWTFDLADDRENGRTMWRRVTFDDESRKRSSISMNHSFDNDKIHQTCSPFTDGGSSFSTVSRCSSLTEHDFDSAGTALTSTTWPGTTSHLQAASSYMNTLPTALHQGMPVAHYDLGNEHLDMLQETGMPFGNFDCSNFGFNEIPPVSLAPQQRHGPTNDASTVPYNMSMQQWYNPYVHAGMDFGATGNVKEIHQVNPNGIAPPMNLQQHFDQQHIVADLPYSPTTETETQPFGTLGHFQRQGSM